MNRTEMRLLLALLLLLAGRAGAQEYGTDYRLKVEVAGESRKAAFFVPKGIKRNAALPLVIALPGNSQGKAFSELGQWQQPAHDARFAVLSVDLKTASKGWLPSEQLEMQRDAEAVLKALEAARETAGQNGVSLDPTAVVLTGWSGATYCTLWLGIRRPDLFLGVCGRAVLFFPEEAEWGKLDRIPPNYDMPILLYRGQLDPHRSAQETELARKTLEAKGWKNVTYKVVEKMAHESKPEIFIEWFQKLLKSTARARREKLKIEREVAELRAQLEAGKPVLGKLAKLADRERRADVVAGAVAFLEEVQAGARQKLEQAAHLEADGQLVDAAELLKAVEKEYRGLPVAEEARKLRARIVKSEAYKADELLRKAREYREKGLLDKARELLEKIVDKYPDTPAAAEAQRLMDS